MRISQTAAATLVVVGFFSALAANAAVHHQHNHHHRFRQHAALAHRDEDSCPAGWVQTSFVTTVTVTSTVTPSSHPIDSTSTKTPTPFSLVISELSAVTSSLSEYTTKLETTVAPAVKKSTTTTTIHTSVAPRFSTTSIPPVKHQPSITSIPPPQKPSSTTTTTKGSATTAAAPNIGQENPIIHSQSLSTVRSSVRATYYVENGVDQGHCSFTGYTLPANIFVTALSVQSWDTASHCGACLEVNNPSTGAKVKAMIVDSCPGCPANGLDLFENTFGQLASTAVGHLSVNWQIVDCALETPLQVVLKNGSDADWFSIQFRNHNKPVSKVEVSAAGGNNWQELGRTQDNYFPKAGGFGGSGTIDVRVTDVTGKTITVSSVPLSSSTTTATSNF